MILYDKGIIGSYNRGNRTIGHFLENSLPILITLPLGFIVYPFPTAMCFVTFSIGRIVYQIGYTTIGFGAHLPGFFMAVFASFTMLGLTFFAFLEMI